MSIPDCRVTTAWDPFPWHRGHEVEGWDVEVIDENNYRRSGPKIGKGLPDHKALQGLRPADGVGF